MEVHNKNQTCFGVYWFIEPAGAVGARPALSAASRSCFAFAMARICDGSEVMIWSSVYEAIVFMATCFKPAKNIPSPTFDSSRRYFSSSVRLNVF